MIGKTKIFLSSYTCKWSLGFKKYQPKNPKSLEWFIDISKKYGLDGVQIADNVFPELLTDFEINKIFDYSISKGIGLQWGFDSWEHEKVERMIKISNMTQSHLLRGVFGRAFVMDNPSKDKRVCKAIEAVEKILPILEESKVTLGLENHFDLKLDELLHLVRTINNKYVKIILDTTNAIGELVSPEKTIELLAPYSIALHFKDYKIKKIIGGYNIIGVAIGEGDQNGNNIIKQALLFNPDMEICIELGSPWPEKEEDIFIIEERDLEISINNTLKYINEYYEGMK